MMENLGKFKSICKPKIQGNAYTRIFKVPMVQKKLLLIGKAFQNTGNQEWHLHFWKIFFPFGDIYLFVSSQLGK